uniref:ATP synthase subunit a n=1 Tax=Ugyops sp. APL-2018 TaxID=2250388 RepID=A0A3G1RJA6_9HEMI|nr:ATP synthase F0 subunit 6 [Ugyops sp. APL-2018]
MTSNLFSSFDPSIKPMIQMNWISMMTATMLLPNKFWTKESRMTMIKNLIKKMMKNEMKPNKNKQMNNLLLASFMLILTNNMMGLTPYTFTSTSHLVVSLSMAMPMWITLMLYGWKNKTNKMFASLLPSGTPTMLMPFMILIETISNLIRPISLSVRLTANMIAGHLLMTLLGNMTQMKTLFMVMTMQMMLMLFEMAVSIIQAYVFTILSTLYSSEIT